ncbi:hypothetical protein PROFUN_02629 [Planoprotostelium fungivorum]|uniref:Uncharacterized protein n=1 Tax=Planoprotostelium fungivorum TaxID=1890364 RepID=A0A2P6NV96_9EUKA|nr:hypothetical protein PROFUN_02629 [Planoprotostelium fungivorum]
MHGPAFSSPLISSHLTFSKFASLCSSLHRSASSCLVAHIHNWLSASVYFSLYLYLLFITSHSGCQTLHMMEERGTHVKLSQIETSFFFLPPVGVWNNRRYHRREYYSGFLYKGFETVTSTVHSLSCPYHVADHHLNCPKVTTCPSRTLGFLILDMSIPLVYPPSPSLRREAPRIVKSLERLTLAKLLTVLCISSRDLLPSRPSLPGKDLRDKFTPLQFDALHHVSCLSRSVSLDNYPLFVGRDAARHQQDTVPRGKQKGRSSSQAAAERIYLCIFPQYSIVIMAHAAALMLLQD